MVTSVDLPLSLMFYHQQLLTVSIGKLCSLFASFNVYVCTLYGYDLGSIANAESSNDKLSGTLNTFSVGQATLYRTQIFTHVRIHV